VRPVINAASLSASHLAVELELFATTLANVVQLGFSKRSPPARTAFALTSSAFG